MQHQLRRLFTLEHGAAGEITHPARQAVQAVLELPVLSPAELPLVANQWYFVAVSFDARNSQATLRQVGVGNRYNSRLGKVAPVQYDSHVRETLRFRARNQDDTPFLMAGARDWHELRGHFVGQTYCGKIDRPGVYQRVLSRGRAQPFIDEPLEEGAFGAGADHQRGLRRHQVRHALAHLAHQRRRHHQPYVP